MPQKICTQCEKTFTPSKGKAWIQVFCGNKCRYMSRSKFKHNNEVLEISCKCCDNKFKPISSKSKFCSNCGPDKGKYYQNRETILERNRKRWAEDTEYRLKKLEQMRDNEVRKIKKGNCVICGKYFEATGSGQHLQILCLDPKCVAQRKSDIDYLYSMRKRKTTPIEKYCIECGKKIEVDPIGVYWFWKYCSIECKYSYKKKQAILHHKIILPDKKCVVCPNWFSPRNRKQVTCSSTCQDSYKKEYFDMYPDKGIRARNLSRDKSTTYRRAWGTVNDVRYDGHKRNALYKQMEDIALEKLPSLGFSNIMSCNSFNTNATGDIRAERLGEVCLVEITFGANHRIFGHIQFCKTWGIKRLYVVFMSRDRRRIRMRSIDPMIYGDRHVSLLRKEVYSDSELMIDGRVVELS